MAHRLPCTNPIAARADVKPRGGTGEAGGSPFRSTWVIMQEHRMEIPTIRLAPIVSALLAPPIGPGLDLAILIRVTAKMPPKNRRRA